MGERPQWITSLRNYVILFGLRLLYSVAPGYIHADEFFQSQEVMARDVFGFDAFVPWEFQGDGTGGMLPGARGSFVTTSVPTAYRSSVFPMYSSGLPYYFLYLLDWCYVQFPSLLGVGSSGRWMSPLALFAFPRFWAFWHSVLVDYLVYRICASMGLRVRSAVVLVYASSWTTLVFHARPFSNTYESFLLVLATYVVVRLRPDTTKMTLSQMRFRTALKNWLLGMVIAAGFFTRFTFLVFAFPLGVFLLWDNLALERDYRRNLGTHRMAALVLQWTLTVFAGFSCVATFCVFVDSLYFGTLRWDSSANLTALVTQAVRDPANLAQKALPALVDLVTGLKVPGFQGHLTITPVNNLLYNSDPANLANHGIHPRWLHAVVNMTLLYGPMYLIALFSMPALRVKGIVKSLGVTADRKQFPTIDAFVLTMIATCILGVLVLSLAPHQEPRFLLPLGFPLTFLCASLMYPDEHFDGRRRRVSISTVPSKAEKEASRRSRRRKQIITVCWCLFNGCCAIFFAIVHQGGVVRSLMRLHEYAPEHRDAVLSAALDDLHPSSTDEVPPLYFQELGEGAGAGAGGGGGGGAGGMLGQQSAGGFPYFDAMLPVRGNSELFNTMQSRSAVFPMRHYGPFDLAPVVPMVFYRSYMPPHCFTMMNSTDVPSKKDDLKTTDDDSTRYEVIDFDIDSTDFSTQLFSVYDTYCAPYLAARREPSERTPPSGGEESTPPPTEGSDSSQRALNVDPADSLVCSVILALPRSVDLTSLLTNVNTVSLSRRPMGTQASRTSVGVDSHGTTRTLGDGGDDTRPGAESNARTWSLQVVRQLDSIWPHLATEQIPKSYNELRFDVYSLRVIHRPRS